MPVFDGDNRLKGPLPSFTNTDDNVTVGGFAAATSTFRKFVSDAADNSLVGSFYTISYRNNKPQGAGVPGAEILAKKFRDRGIAYNAGDQSDLYRVNKDNYKALNAKLVPILGQYEFVKKRLEASNGHTSLNQKLHAKFAVSTKSNDYVVSTQNLNTTYTKQKRLTQINLTIVGKDQQIASDLRKVQNFVTDRLTTTSSLQRLKYSLTSGNVLLSGKGAENVVKGAYLRSINKAQKNDPVLLLGAYSTDKDVATALVKASKRGARVTVVHQNPDTDQGGGNKKGTKEFLAQLVQPGSKVTLLMQDTSVPSKDTLLMHAKVLITKDTIIAGGTNLTKSGLQNTVDVSLLLNNSKLASKTGSDFLKVIKDPSLQFRTFSSRDFQGKKESTKTGSISDILLPEYSTRTTDNNAKNRSYTKRTPILLPTKLPKEYAKEFKGNDIDLYQNLYATATGTTGTGPGAYMRQLMDKQLNEAGYGSAFNQLFGTNLYQEGRGILGTAVAGIGRMLDTLSGFYYLREIKEREAGKNDGTLRELNRQQYNKAAPVGPFESTLTFATDAVASTAAAVGSYFALSHGLSLFRAHLEDKAFEAAKAATKAGGASIGDLFRQVAAVGEELGGTFNQSAALAYIFENSILEGSDTNVNLRSERLRKAVDTTGELEKIFGTTPTEELTPAQKDLKRTYEAIKVQVGEKSKALLEIGDEKQRIAALEKLQKETFGYNRVAGTVELKPTGLLSSQYGLMNVIRRADSIAFRLFYKPVIEQIADVPGDKREFLTAMQQKQDVADSRGILSLLDAEGGFSPEPITKNIGSEAQRANAKADNAIGRFIRASPFLWFKELREILGNKPIVEMSGGREVPGTDRSFSALITPGFSSLTERIETLYRTVNSYGTVGLRGSIREAAVVFNKQNALLEALNEATPDQEKVNKAFRGFREAQSKRGVDLTSAKPEGRGAFEVFRKALFLTGGLLLADKLVDHYFGKDQGIDLFTQIAANATGALRDNEGRAIGEQEYVGTMPALLRAGALAGGALAGGYVFSKNNVPIPIPEGKVIQELGDAKVFTGSRFSYTGAFLGGAAALLLAQASVSATATLLNLMSGKDRSKNFRPDTDSLAAASVIGRAVKRSEQKPTISASEYSMASALKVLAERLVKPDIESKEVTYTQAFQIPNPIFQFSLVTRNDPKAGVSSIAAGFQLMPSLGTGFIPVAPFGLKTSARPSMIRASYKEKDIALSVEYDGPDGLAKWKQNVEKKRDQLYAQNTALSVIETANDLLDVFQFFPESATFGAATALGAATYIGSIFDTFRNTGAADTLETLTEAARANRNSMRTLGNLAEVGGSLVTKAYALSQVPTVITPNLAVHLGAAILNKDLTRGRAALIGKNLRGVAPFALSFLALAALADKSGYSNTRQKTLEEIEKAKKDPDYLPNYAGLAFNELLTKVGTGTVGALYFGTAYKRAGVFAEVSSFADVTGEDTKSKWQRRMFEMYEENYENLLTRTTTGVPEELTNKNLREALDLIKEKRTALKTAQKEAHLLFDDELYRFVTQARPQLVETAGLRTKLFARTTFKYAALAGLLAAAFTQAGSLKEGNPLNILRLTGYGNASAEEAARAGRAGYRDLPRKTNLVSFFGDKLNEILIGAGLKKATGGYQDNPGMFASLAGPFGVSEGAYGPRAYMQSTTRFMDVSGSESSIIRGLTNTREGALILASILTKTGRGKTDITSLYYGAIGAAPRKQAMRRAFGGAIASDSELDAASGSAGLLMALSRRQFVLNQLAQQRPQELLLRLHKENIQKRVIAKARGKEIAEPNLIRLLPVPGQKYSPNDPIKDLMRMMLGENPESIDPTEFGNYSGVARKQYEEELPLVPFFTNTLKTGLRSLEVGNYTSGLVTLGLLTGLTVAGASSTFNFVSAVYTAATSNSYPGAMYSSDELLSFLRPDYRLIASSDKITFKFDANGRQDPSPRVTTLTDEIAKDFDPSSAQGYSEQRLDIFRKDVLNAEELDIENIREKYRAFYRDRAPIFGKSADDLAGTVDTVFDNWKLEEQFARIDKYSIEETSKLMAKKATVAFLLRHLDQRAVSSVPKDVEGSSPIRTTTFKPATAKATQAVRELNQLFSEGYGVGLGIAGRGAASAFQHTINLAQLYSIASGLGGLSSNSETERRQYAYMTSAKTLEFGLGAYGMGLAMRGLMVAPLMFLTAGAIALGLNQIDKYLFKEQGLAALRKGFNFINKNIAQPVVRTGAQALLSLTSSEASRAALKIFNIPFDLLSPTLTSLYEKSRSNPALALLGSMFLPETLQSFMSEQAGLIPAPYSFQGERMEEFTVAEQQQNELRKAKARVYRTTQLNSDLDSDLVSPALLGRPIGYQQSFFDQNLFETKGYLRDRVLAGYAPQSSVSGLLLLGLRRRQDMLNMTANSMYFRRPKQRARYTAAKNTMEIGTLLAASSFSEYGNVSSKTLQLLETPVEVIQKSARALSNLDQAEKVVNYIDTGINKFAANLAEREAARAAAQEASGSMAGSSVARSLFVKLAKASRQLMPMLPTSAFTFVLTKTVADLAILGIKGPRDKDNNAVASIAIAGTAAVVVPVLGRRYLRSITGESVGGVKEAVSLSSKFAKWSAASFVGASTGYLLSSYIEKLFGLDQEEDAAVTNTVRVSAASISILGSIAAYNKLSAAKAREGSLLTALSKSSMLETIRNNKGKTALAALAFVALPLVVDVFRSDETSNVSKNIVATALVLAGGTALLAAKYGIPKPVKNVVDGTLELKESISSGIGKFAEDFKALKAVRASKGVLKAAGGATKLVTNRFSQGAGYLVLGLAPLLVAGNSMFFSEPLNQYSTADSYKEAYKNLGSGIVSALLFSLGSRFSSALALQAYADNFFENSTIFSDFVRRRYEVDKLLSPQEVIARNKRAVVEAVSYSAAAIAGSVVGAVSAEAAVKKGSGAGALRHLSGTVTSLLPAGLAVADLIEKFIPTKITNDIFKDKSRTVEGVYGSMQNAGFFSGNPLIAVGTVGVSWFGGNRIKGYLRERMFANIDTRQEVRELDERRRTYARAGGAVSALAALAFVGFGLALGALPALTLIASAYFVGSFVGSVLGFESYIAGKSKDGRDEFYTNMATIGRAGRKTIGKRSDSKYVSGKQSGSLMFAEGDGYDPKTNTIYLSQDQYYGSYTKFKRNTPDLDLYYFIRQEEARAKQYSKGKLIPLDTSIPLSREKLIDWGTKELGKGLKKEQVNETANVREQLATKLAESIGLKEEASTVGDEAKNSPLAREYVIGIAASKETALNQRSRFGRTFNTTPRFDIVTSFLSSRRRPRSPDLDSVVDSNAAQTEETRAAAPAELEDTVKAAKEAREKVTGVLNRTLKRKTPRVAPVGVTGSSLQRTFEAFKQNIGLGEGSKTTQLKTFTKDTAIGGRTGVGLIGIQTLEDSYVRNKSIKQSLQEQLIAGATVGTSVTAGFAAAQAAFQEAFLQISRNVDDAKVRAAGATKLLASGLIGFAFREAAASTMRVLRKTGLLKDTTNEQIKTTADTVGITTGVGAFGLEVFKQARPTQAANLARRLGIPAVKRALSLDTLGKAYNSVGQFIKNTPVVRAIKESRIGPRLSQANAAGRSLGGVVSAAFGLLDYQERIQQGQTQQQALIGAGSRAVLSFVTYLAAGALASAAAIAAVPTTGGVGSAPVFLATLGLATAGNIGIVDPLVSQIDYATGAKKRSLVERMKIAREQEARTKEKAKVDKQFAKTRNGIGNFLGSVFNFLFGIKPADASTFEEQMLASQRRADALKSTFPTVNKATVRSLSEESGQLVKEVKETEKPWWEKTFDFLVGLAKKGVDKFKSGFENAYRQTTSAFERVGQAITQGVGAIGDALGAGVEGLQFQAGLGKIEMSALSKEDVSALGRMVAAEAAGESALGKAGVLAVILNRYRLIRSGQARPSQFMIFGKSGDQVTIRDILFARNQFQPIRDGNFARTSVSSGNAALAAAIRMGGNDPKAFKDNLKKAGYSEKDAEYVLRSVGFYNPGASSSNPYGTRNVFVGRHAFQQSRDVKLTGAIGSIDAVVETPLGNAFGGGLRGNQYVFDTGLKTGPSHTIGGSAAYHQDLSFGSHVSLEQQRLLILQLAKGYDAMGRKLELSNEGAPTTPFPINGTAQQQNAWILAARRAHRARNGGTGRDAIDFYTPLKGQNRFGKSVENTSMYAPFIPGAKLEYSKGGAGGAQVRAYVGGRLVYALIHGNQSLPLPKDRLLPSAAPAQQSESAVTNFAGGRLRAPVRNGIANVLAGTRGRPNWNQGLGAGRGHQGQDLGTEANDPVFARRAGRVIDWGPNFSRDKRQRGGYIRIEYEDGTIGTYGHINTGLRQGARVEAGQQVGTVFDDHRDGRNNSHLHYELWKNRNRQVLDPTSVLRESLSVGGRPARAEVPIAPVLPGGGIVAANGSSRLPAYRPSRFPRAGERTWQANTNYRPAQILIMAGHADAYAGAAGSRNQTGAAGEKQVNMLLLNRLEQRTKQLGLTSVSFYRPTGRNADQWQVARSATARGTYVLELHGDASDGTGRTGLIIGPPDTRRFGELRGAAVAKPNSLDANLAMTYGSFAWNHGDLGLPNRGGRILEAYVANRSIVNRILNARTVAERNAALDEIINAGLIQSLIQNHTSRGGTLRGNPPRAGAPGRPAAGNTRPNTRPAGANTRPNNRTRRPDNRRAAVVRPQEELVAVATRQAIVNANLPATTKNPLLTAAQVVVKAVATATAVPPAPDKVVLRRQPPQAVQQPAAADPLKKRNVGRPIPAVEVAQGEQGFQVIPQLFWNLTNHLAQEALEGTNQNATAAAAHEPTPLGSRGSGSRTPFGYNLSTAQLG